MVSAGLHAPSDGQGPSLGAEETLLTKVLDRFREDQVYLRAGSRGPRERSSLRILERDCSTLPQASGAWVRSFDFNVDAQVKVGISVLVAAGTANAGYYYLLETGTTIAGAKTFSGRTVVFNSDVNEFAEPFTFKVNFGAGTLVADDTYAIGCSGVNQAIILTSDTVVDTNLAHAWCVTLMYDGARVRFGVSRAGQPRDTSTSMVTGAPATGVVKQRFWEHTMLGRGRNYGHGESGSDISATRASFGAIRFLNAIAYNDGAHDTGSTGTILPPATTPSALGSYWNGSAAVPGQKFFFRPTLETVRYSPDGTLRRGYLCETEPGRGHAWIVPARSLPVDRSRTAASRESRSTVDPLRPTVGLRYLPAHGATAYSRA